MGTRKDILRKFGEWRKEGGPKGRERGEGEGGEDEGMVFPRWGKDRVGKQGKIYLD